MEVRDIKLTSLHVPLGLWYSLIRVLRQRGRGARESGAFLLGKAESNKITMFIPYDDLDPHCLDEGIIIFKGYGFIPLWKICEEKNLRVLADVHTHGSWMVFQSGADKAHPMISKKGHIALILPNFAQNHFLNFKGIGTYEYLGNDKWRTWNTKTGRIKWTLT